MNCFDILDRTKGYSIRLSRVELLLEYYDNGQLMEKAYYRNGRIYGKRLIYNHSDGRLLDKSYWDNGEKITEEEYNELF